MKYSVLRLIWYPGTCVGAHGQIILETAAEPPPNVTAKHLAAWCLTGEQREALTPITLH